MRTTTTRRRALPAAVTAALAVALGVAGCAATGGPDGASATTDGGGQVGDAEHSDGDADPPEEGGGSASSRPFGAPGEAATAAPSGSPVLLTDLRIGTHDGFDRVVFEYRGEGEPGWDVRYVDEAISDGIGEPVEVSGGAVLEVRTSGVRYPEEGDEDAFRGTAPGPVRLRAAGTVEISEVVYDHVFEGYGTTFIGLDGNERHPVRAFLVPEPTRLVVDIEHGS